MALVDCYVALDEVKRALNIASALEDDTVEMSITAACRALEAHCGQFFYDTDVVSARTFEVKSRDMVYVDPFHTTTGLVVKTDTAADGSYGTTWAAADYELERFGGYMADMLSAPYDTIRGVGTYGFVYPTRRRFTLQVTARWGWAAVPAPIQQASMLISGDLWKRRETPFGVTTTDFGPIRVSNNIIGKLDALVGPYRRYDRVVGF